MEPMEDNMEFEGRVTYYQLDQARAPQGRAPMTERKRNGSRRKLLAGGLFALGDYRAARRTTVEACAQSMSERILKPCAPARRSWRRR